MTLLVTIKRCAYYFGQVLEILGNFLFQHVITLVKKQKRGIERSKRSEVRRTFRVVLISCVSQVPQTKKVASSTTETRP